MKQAEFLHTVMPFKDKLFRLAKRLLTSTEEAEDALQEVLLKLWVNKGKITAYRSVEAFAVTTTRNYCLDRLRSKQASNLKLAHSNYTDEASSLQRQVEARDSVSLMHKIMQGLPEQQKMVLQLRDVEQYEFEEIGDMLEMNPASVRVALSRARKAVREELIKKHNYGVG
ncbi:RNA polymerase sigma factor [Sinomicrobium soli]|uniref:RNA polymerase sigma factor n=1 Tax=Sinomicrobium sp. N-1-3-6 TaxID=2219864 RepID=UPI000DCE84D1|nr:sigma-70 family RNA polymerase sigma factor [Sinomicrobium sp. N-1-3-6]RAV30333.1 RNA polymerase subunit sigma-70 [Sinomicrobium sp. N-1-3-6]